MAQQERLVVSGLFGPTGMLHACRVADRQLRRELRQTLKPVGEAVRSEAAIRAAPKNRRTAAGYRVRVRQTGIFVEQSQRKTTGRHPQWGGYQMRHFLLPAQRDKEAETMRVLAEKTNEI